MNNLEQSINNVLERVRVYPFHLVDSVNVVGQYDVIDDRGKVLFTGMVDEAIDYYEQVTGEAREVLL